MLKHAPHFVFIACMLFLLRSLRHYLIQPVELCADSFLLAGEPVAFDGFSNTVTNINEPHEYVTNNTNNNTEMHDREIAAITSTAVHNGPISYVGLGCDDMSSRQQGTNHSPSLPPTPVLSYSPLLISPSVILPPPCPSSSPPHLTPRNSPLPPYSVHDDNEPLSSPRPPPIPPPLPPPPPSPPKESHVLFPHRHEDPLSMLPDEPPQLLPSILPNLANRVSRLFSPRTHLLPPRAPVRRHRVSSDALVSPAVADDRRDERVTCNYSLPVDQMRSNVEFSRIPTDTDDGYTPDVLLHYLNPDDQYNELLSDHQQHVLTQDLQQQLLIQHKNQLNQEQIEAVAQRRLQQQQNYRNYKEREYLQLLRQGQLLQDQRQSTLPAQGQQPRNFSLSPRHLTPAPQQQYKQLSRPLQQAGPLLSTVRPPRSDRSDNTARMQRQQDSVTHESAALAGKTHRHKVLLHHLPTVDEGVTYM